MSQTQAQRTLILQQLAEQSRAACMACSSAERIGDDAVRCSASRRQEDFKFGRCRLRKWPARPKLPGVWVLSSPRTGSYYLCALLNRIGFDPPLKEWCHHEIKQRINDPPRNNKIHTFQLGHRGVSIEGVLEEYPDTRFVLLRRRDHIACAVSNYIGMHTHMLLITSEQQAEVYARLKPIPFDEQRMLKCYARVQEEGRFWSRHMDALGVRYHTVFYEDLQSDPAGTMQRLIDELGIVRDPARCLQGVPNRRQSALRTESKVFAERLRALVDRDAAGHQA